MREAVIIKSMENVEDLKRALIENSLSVAHEMVLMRTRLDAFEKILFWSRFSLLSALIVSIASPEWMSRIVQKIHSKEIEKFNAAMKRPSLVKPQGGLCAH